MPKEKMKISDRARIFAPYDALSGFKDALREKEEIKEERKEMSSELLDELSNVYFLLKTGNMIKIKYYDNKEKRYLFKEGILTKIDKDNRVLIIVKDKIKMDDIFSIEIIEENGI